MKTIEDFLNLNNKLSYRQLIFKKYKPIWKFFAILPFILSVIFIINIMIIDFKYENNYFPLILIITPFLFFSIYFIHTRDIIIIKQNHSDILEYEEQKKYYSMRKIREKVFNKYINKKDLKNDAILFLIDSIKNDNQLSKYNPTFFFRSFSLMIALLIGMFLTGITNFSNDFNEFMFVLKYSVAIFLTVLIPIWFLERTLVKEFVLFKRKKENRLIRILENIYFEKNIEQIIEIENKLIIDNMKKTEKLDIILNTLYEVNINSSNADQYNKGYIIKSICETMNVNLKEGEDKILENILISDGNVEYLHDVLKMAVRITSNGINFINSGGYQQLELDNLQLQKKDNLEFKLLRSNILTNRWAIFGIATSILISLIALIVALLK